MKTPALVCALQAAVILSLTPSSPAQDNVTVPKSRLEELERKERELEQLKGGLNKTNTENVAPKSDQAKSEQPKPLPATNAPSAAPAVAYVSAPIASLPPLSTGDVVDSMDLANYYRTDAASADRRYRHQKFTVRGEIVGFEKPLLIRNYKILLKTPDHTRVVCDFLPPPNSNAVFTTDHGSQLVAMTVATKQGREFEARVPMAKIGDLAIIKGECKGLHDSEIKMSCWELSLMK
jgi:hypothetical protein